MLAASCSPESRAVLLSPKIWLIDASNCKQQEIKTRDQFKPPLHASSP